MARLASVMIRSASAWSSRLDGVGDAVAQVVVEQLHGDALQRLGGGGHLGEHVDAVRVVLDHPLQPADLALDALQPRQHRRFVVVVPGRRRP